MKKTSQKIYLFLTWGFTFLLVASPSTLSFAESKSSDKLSDKSSDSRGKEGASLIPPKLPDETGIAPFEYEPTDPVFWDKVKELKSEDNFPAIIALASEALGNLDPQISEAKEARLALAIGLKGLKISYGASKIFMDLVRTYNGTSIGNASLDALDDIAQNFYYDRRELGDAVLNSLEFAPLPPKIQSFIAYHKAMSDLSLGFNKWSQDEFKQITKNSYWDQQVEYFKALNEVNQDKIKDAKARFQKIIEQQGVAEKIRNQAYLQLARLIFEEGDFLRAYTMYRMVQVPVREKGRILLEEAWAKYYLKEYSQALGMIKALEAPYFDPSLTAERYVLEMIIYKQLCHYEAVDSSVKAFHSRFKNALKAIRDRKDLSKNTTLSSQALLDQRLQYDANFISQLREERKELESYNWKQFSFFKPMLQAYASKEKDLIKRNEPKLKEKVKELANDLLSAKEQVDYLEYTAKLDSLRIVRKGENRHYVSEKISYIKFDRIYWPAGKEYWWDELDNYRVLISSRCGEKSEATSNDEIDKELK